MIILDAGHWLENWSPDADDLVPDYTASVLRGVEVIQEDGPWAHWCGYEVRCATLTCGCVFVLTPGTTFVVYPPRCESEDRIGVLCPACQLLTASSRFRVFDDDFCDMAADVSDDVAVEESGNA